MMKKKKKKINIAMIIIITIILTLQSLLPRGLPGTYLHLDGG